MKSEHSERCGPQEKQCTKGWHEKKMLQINSLRSSVKTLAKKNKPNNIRRKETTVDNNEPENSNVLQSNQ